MAKVRLGEKDRPDYERGDEWFDVELDLAGTDELPWDVLDGIEQVLGGQSLFTLRFYSARHLRVAMWMARRSAGVTEPFAKFKPNPYAYQWDTTDADEPEPAAAGDADPPAPSSAAHTPEPSAPPA